MNSFKLDSNRLKNYFNENGYVIVKNLFTDKFCDNFLNKVIKYANPEFAPIMNPDRTEFLVAQIVDRINKIETLGEKANLIKALKKDCDYFRSVMTNKKILKLLQKIKNNRKIYALMSQMIFKKANSKFSKQQWEPHQDNSYPMNKNGEYITINIFLNKSNKENGTLYVWEKSHKSGIFDFQNKISYREKDNKPGNVVIAKKKFNIKILKFKKGDTLILNGNLVHGSFPNLSKKNSRPLYSVSYIPKGERFVPGKNAQRRILN